MELISVIIPVYNRQDFIKEAVTSVLEQTYKNFELIVVDDHSTDETKRALSDFNIKVIDSTGKGVSAARNTGIRNSKGRWLTFLDSDDLWYDNKLQVQFDYHNNNQGKLISYTEETWYRKGRLVNPCKHHKKYSGEIFKSLLPLCLISPSSVMIRRDCLLQRGVFNEEFIACEDYDLWLRLGSVFEIILIEQELIIKRNGHNGQLSSEVWGQDRFRIQALKNIIREGILSPDYLMSAFNVLNKKCSIYANGCRKRGRLTEADELLTMCEELRKENELIL